MTTQMPLPKDPVAQEIQGLVSQILHDFISHFTAISTGLEMPVHMAKDIFPMLTQSRQQLNAYLNLMRYLFSQGEGADQQGTQMIVAYGDTLGIIIQGHSLHNCKLITGLTLWAMKLFQGRCQTIITREDNRICMLCPALKMPTHEMNVLLNKEPCKSPRDSLSAYLSRLLHQEKLSVSFDFPTPQEMIISLCQS